jgi:S-adenosylmethionine synthetase
VRSPPTSTSTSPASCAPPSTSIGYDRESYGFDGNTCGVMVTIDEQSPDIAQGVDASEEVRSGTAGEESSRSRAPATRG